VVAAILLLLKVAVMAVILAIGMDSTLQDLTYLWRRPGLLLRSLLAMYVVVPLVALLFVKLLVLPPGVEIALLVLAVSAGGLMLPRKLMGVGDGSYVLSLVVLSSLVAIVTVPAGLALFGPLFGDSVALMPIEVARVLGRVFLLPLVVGMLVHWLVPEISSRMSERLLLVGSGVLAVCILLLLVTNGGLILEAGWPALLALGGMTLVAMAVGHVLGGPDPDNRTVLAISCATRHAGLMVLVAASVPGPRTAALVGAYFVASAAVTIPYLRWRRRLPSTGQTSND
jgi:BASS family bile acid:Na+ symporter